jgi:hypothetical protein
MVRVNVFKISIMRTKFLYNASSKNLLLCIYFWRNLIRIVAFMIVFIYLMLHLVDKRADEQVWTFHRVLLAVPIFFVAVAFEMGDTLYAVPFLFSAGGRWGG